MIGIVALSALVFTLAIRFLPLRESQAVSGSASRPADGGARGRAAGSPPGEPAARLADVCARRAAVYQALALGFREPTAAYLEALAAGGELVDGLRAAVAWLGTDADLYEPALTALSRAAAAEPRSAAALRPWPSSTPACSPAPAGRL